ncbi:hypothetical protein HBB16_04300 [Pseudonocardia sp. MCCB 268]|nr:hypothetical protein [Pseudonocardia cytotoxica]
MELLLPLTSRPSCRPVTRSQYAGRPRWPGCWSASLPGPHWAAGPPLHQTLRHARVLRAAAALFTIGDRSSGWLSSGSPGIHRQAMAACRPGGVALSGSATLLGLGLIATRLRVSLPARWSRPLTAAALFVRLAALSSCSRPRRRAGSDSTLQQPSLSQ